MHHAQVNCITELLPERALARAADLDAYYSARGKPTGPLHDACEAPAHGAAYCGEGEAKCNKRSDLGALLSRKIGGVRYPSSALH